MVSNRVVEIPAYLAGIFAMDYLGRRLVLNITLIAGGAFCLVAGLISKGEKTLILPSYTFIRLKASNFG